ncbi:MAG: protein TolQ [Rhodospirillales bacterium]|nr:protein TolQ [Alphaproteobacteria bacterium]MCB9987393.1 protein TolQ [Rhodospirillales bacterium]USO07625.1 MAG: protein TolQ [Rhodospirillales bacterium]
MTAAATIPDRAVDAAVLAGSVSHNLSPFGLFWNADIIGKCVILMLITASIWCWAIIFDKLRTLKATRRRADKFEEAFWSGEPLDKLYERVRQSRPDPILKTFLAGMEEWRLGMSDNKGAGSEALGTNLQQRIERAMSVMIGREMEKLERSMTFLANVGSAAPFIGLFGTVWGIMRSFTAIAGSKNASLAVVAPGIAEALFATAIGLVAAIPAVIAYNKFSSDLNRYNDRLENFATEFSAILGRHLTSRTK